MTKTSGATIILIETDRSSPDLFKRVFSDEGYTVLADTSATAVIQKFEARRSKVKLVVFDASTPEWLSAVSGISGRLKDALWNLPLLVIAKEDADHLVLRGADVVLRKPFDLETLLCAMEAVCGS